MNAFISLSLCLAAPAMAEAQQEPAVVVQQLTADLEQRLIEWNGAVMRPFDSSNGVLFGTVQRREAEFRAVMLIGRLGNLRQNARPAVPLLCRIVREHGYPFMGTNMAEAAAEALSQIGDAEALVVLADAARTGSPELRKKALKAIEAISPFRYFLIRYERGLGFAVLLLAAGVIAVLRGSMVQRRVCDVPVVQG